MRFEMVFVRTNETLIGEVTSFGAVHQAALPDAGAVVEIVVNEARIGRANQI